MPHEGNTGVFRCHATTVIRDADVGCTPVPDFAGDVFCPGIKGVFQQLLDDGRRALHYLAGHNQVGHMGGENIDNRQSLHLQQIEILYRISTQNATGKSHKTVNVQKKLDVRKNVRYNISDLLKWRKKEMTAVNATTARQNLYQLIAEVNRNSMPVVITNNRGKNAVLLSEEDWNALQETVYLNSVPGLAESILAGDEALEEREIYDPDKEW